MNILRPIVIYTVTRNSFQGLVFNINLGDSDPATAGQNEGSMIDFHAELKNHEIILAYFSYPECSVCKVLKPKVQEFLRDYPGVTFLYVDIHQYPEISGQLLVFAVPTIIIFYQGKEAARFSRHFSIQDLETALNRLLTTNFNS